MAVGSRRLRAGAALRCYASEPIYGPTAPDHIARTFVESLATATRNISVPY